MSYAFLNLSRGSTHALPTLEGRKKLVRKISKKAESVDLTNFHKTFLLVLKSIFNAKAYSTFILTLRCSSAQVARPTVLVLSFHVRV